MTYEQFLKVLQSCRILVSTGRDLRLEVKGHWGDTKIEAMKEYGEYRWNPEEYNRDLANEKRECIYMTWTGESRDGGSCWNDEEKDRHYIHSGEPEPIEFKIFDDVLRIVCPNITYLQYKEIAPLIQRGDNKIDEYYGNYTIKEYKVVWLRDLYDALRKKDLIESKFIG